MHKTQLGVLGMSIKHEVAQTTPVSHVLLDYLFTDKLLIVVANTCA